VIVFGLGRDNVRARFGVLGRGIPSPAGADGTAISVTAAFGIAEFSTVEMLTDAIELADRRMYEEKRAFKEARAAASPALD
jgi:GGDEF domain-containing protein